MSCILGLEPFHWQAIIGFVFLSFGTLLYNEILVLPFWGLDQNTKEKIAERDGKAKRDAGYMSATSPHAPYDANRNKRLLMKTDDEHYDQIADDGREYDMNMNHSDSTYPSNK